MVGRAQSNGISDAGLPQVFGRYLLVQRLSRGGMGEIFLGRHGLSGFEKLCVIKKVLPHLSEDEQFISRFVDEAQVAIKLQHANIAQVFEVGRVEAEYFLALEYVEGRDLRRTLRVLRDQRERLPPDLAIFVAREILSGLSYAHRRTDGRGNSLELVHCDISPPNVMLSFEGETKLIDFGIAKSAAKATATDPKLGFGKFGYMAPEQLIRGCDVDYRTDIYAAGVVLHELLTGERLYPMGETPDYRALARMVAKGRHPMPSHVDKRLAAFDHLVARALRPDPDQRYQSAAEFRDALQHVLVAINPTISSDILGSFMRRLFADEVAEQRQAAARAEATDLQPWADLLTTQSATTVSFAMAHMPLVAPETAMVSRPLALPLRATQRRGLLVTAILGGLVLVATVIAVVVGGDQGEATVTSPPPPDAIAVAVAAIITDAGAIVVDAEAVAVDAGMAAAALREPVTPRVARPLRPDKRHVAKVVDAAVRPRTASKKAIHSKFRKVSREYQSFKKRYGARFEQDWADLATYVQFAKSSDKLKTLDRKLDAFRTRMRRARRE